MTRRYNLSHSAGQPMPEDWIHLPDSVVAASDYDALAARLRGLIVAICEAQEEGGDVALAIDEAGRAVARPANSAGDAT